MKPQISVTKSFKWEMAHMLAHHEGACRNIHGHSYQLEITVVRNSERLEHDMVEDFSHLEKLVRALIVDRYDHAFLYWENSDDEGERALAEVARKYNHKVVGMALRPTAENMADDIFELLRKPLNETGLSLHRLRLWETASSYVEICTNA